MQLLRLHRYGEEKMEERWHWREKRCTREEFESFLRKKIVNKIEDKEIQEYLSEEIEKAHFFCHDR